MRSSPVERATWLSLLAYCADQENGGVIKSCTDWKDRTWQQTCGVTLKEVRADTRLWSWSESSLTVWAYPAEKEQIVKQKRAYASSGGKASGQSRREPNAEAYASANGEADAKQKLERNGKGIGKEVEEKGIGAGSQRPTLAIALLWAAEAGITPDIANLWWLTRDGDGWMKSDGGGGQNRIPPGGERSDLSRFALREKQRQAEASAKNAPKPQKPNRNCL